MTTSKPLDDKLSAHATAIQRALAVPQQAEVFRYAVEAGYLAALADGDADAEEMATIVRSLYGLSSGLVVDWEIDALIDECNEAIGGEGHRARAQVVGEKLAALGQIEIGLLVASLVALASNGLDKREATMLESIGKAGGLDKAALTEIVKRARGLIPAAK
jgi:tellurite resistance protein